MVLEASESEILTPEEQELEQVIDETSKEADLLKAEIPTEVISSDEERKEEIKKLEQTLTELYIKHPKKIIKSPSYKKLLELVNEEYSYLISKNDYNGLITFADATMMFYDSIASTDDNVDVKIWYQKGLEARKRKFNYLVSQNDYEGAIKFADDMKNFYKKISSGHSKELWHRKGLDARNKKFDYLISQNDYEGAVKFADDMMNFYESIGSGSGQRTRHDKGLEARNNKFDHLISKNDYEGAKKLSTEYVRYYENIRDTTKKEIWIQKLIEIKK